MKTLLFLGYGPEETTLHQGLSILGWRVHHSTEAQNDFSEYDAIVSFGYRHIIDESTLSSAKGPVVNLHISYLPFNRGAHPNFWAHYDRTPHGVTIHQVTPSLDLGPIFAQRIVVFEQNEDTFRKTQERLLLEVESLFLDFAEEILSGTLNPEPQVGPGSYHRKADLPKDFQGWDSKISPEIERLRSMSEKTALEQKLLLIDEIEKVRTRNNVNWMDILRLAFVSNPDEAKKLIRRINDQDNKIAELFAELGK